MLLIKLKIITLILLLILTGAVAAAAEKVDFDIRQQSLRAALQAFAEQANIQLMYSPQVVPQQTSRVLQGSYSIEEALTKLIRDTGLEFVIRDSVIIIRANRKLLATPPVNNELSSETPPTSPNLLEEFIVTAQKREERLQDVPISILMAKGEDIQAAGINRLESLAPLMPGFHFSEAVAANDQLFMRGLGSGVNFGFENAVGQVIDDFFYGRSRFGRAAFLDVERVEVLKGPQGALIGKNTTAGAVNITSKAPSEEFEGWLVGSYELEADQGYTFEGAVSGPLHESLAARLALRIDKRDGWTHNLVTGEDSQSVDDFTGRITLNWRLRENFDAAMSYQRGDFKREGRAREISHCGQVLLDFIEQEGIPEDCRANLERSAVGVRNGEGDFQDFITDFDTFGLTLHWDFNQLRLTSLTGYAQYDVADQIASGLIPVEILNIDAGEKWRQWTQELRITSEQGKTFDYIMGLYYMRTDQTSSLDAHFPAGTTGGPATRVVSTRQDGDSIAAFGQLTWNINDLLSVSAGARFTREKEEARSLQFPAKLYTRTAIDGVTGPAAETHDVVQDRDEDNLSPSLTLEWRPSDDAMLYASIRKGFKGGGFDHQLTGGQSSAEQNFQFNKEQVIAYELGSKLTLSGGLSQINFAIFRNDFEDLQVSSVQNDITFSVGNAASAVTQGIELDGRWLPHENLYLSWAISYLDARYERFDNAPCSEYQVRELSPACRLLSPTSGIQNLSDKRLQFAPEWSIFAGAEYHLELPRGLELISVLQLYYSDSVALALDLDPNTIQDEYTKINARLTLTNEHRNWELSIVGRNLSNEITSNFSNDLSGKLSEGSYFKLLESPRAVSVQMLIRF